MSGVGPRVEWASGPTRLAPIQSRTEGGQGAPPKVCCSLVGHRPAGHPSASRCRCRLECSPGCQRESDTTRRAKGANRFSVLLPACPLECPGHIIACTVEGSEVGAQRPGGCRVVPIGTNRGGVAGGGWWAVR